MTSDQQFKQDQAFFTDPHNPNHARSQQLLESVAQHNINAREHHPLNAPVSEEELKDEKDAILNDRQRVHGVRVYADNMEHKEHHPVSFREGAQVRGAALTGARPVPLSRQEQIAQDRAFFTDPNNPNHARSQQLLDFAAEQYINAREHHPPGTHVPAEKIQHEANAILRDPNRLNGVTMFVKSEELREHGPQMVNANMHLQDNVGYFTQNQEHMKLLIQDITKQVISHEHNQGDPKRIEGEVQQNLQAILSNPRLLQQWHDHVERQQPHGRDGTPVPEQANLQGHADPRVAQTYARATEALKDPNVQAALQEARPELIKLKDGMQSEMLEYTRAIHRATNGHRTQQELQQDFAEISKVGTELRAMELKATGELGKDLREHGVNPDDPNMKSLASVAVHEMSGMMLKNAESAVRLEEAHNAPPQNVPDARLPGGAKVIKV